MHVSPPRALEELGRRALVHPAAAKRVVEAVDAREVRSHHVEVVGDPLHVGQCQSPSGGGEVLADHVPPVVQVGDAGRHLHRPEHRHIQVRLAAAPVRPGHVHVPQGGVQVGLVVRGELLADDVAGVGDSMLLAPAADRLVIRPAIQFRHPLPVVSPRRLGLRPVGHQVDQLLDAEVLLELGRPGQAGGDRAGEIVAVVEVVDHAHLIGEDADDHVAEIFLQPFVVDLVRQFHEPGHRFGLEQVHVAWQAGGVGVALDARKINVRLVEAEPRHRPASIRQIRAVVVERQNPVSLGIPRLNAQELTIAQVFRPVELGRPVDLPIRIPQKPHPVLGEVANDPTGHRAAGPVVLVVQPDLHAQPLGLAAGVVDHRQVFLAQVGCDQGVAGMDQYRHDLLTAALFELPGDLLSGHAAVPEPERVRTELVGRRRKNRLDVHNSLMFSDCITGRDHSSPAGGWPDPGGVATRRLDAGLVTLELFYLGFCVVWRN